MKDIIIVADGKNVRSDQLALIGIALRAKGYAVIAVRLSDYPTKFNIFDLSNLSSIEIEEVRELCHKSLEQ